MRQALRQVDAEPLQHSPAQAILDERSIRYLVLSDPPGLDDARQQILAMWSAADWELWYLDGRTAIYGRSGSAPLRLDPVAMAFAPAPSAKTAGPITPPPPSLRAAPRDDDWWAMLTSPPRRTPLATSEALLWSILGEIHQSRASQERALLADVAGRLATPRDPLGQLVFAVVGSTATARALAAADPLTSQDGLNAALPILALRAAREAIRENPQDPEAFAILAETYLALPTAPDTRQVVTLAALRSYAKRLPRGDSLRAQPHLANFPMLARLAQTHFQAGHFDLGVEAAEQALEHLEVRAPPTMPPEQVEQLRQGQREQLRQLKEELRRREDRYQLVRSTNEPGVSYRQADALGLTRKMVDSLQMSDEFFPPEGDPFMSMQRALRVQILTGDVEPAQQSFRDGYVSGPAPQPMRHLQVLASLASGDLDQTIEVFDTLRQNDNLMRPDEIVADLGMAAAPPLAWVALDRVWVSQKQIATNLDYLVRRGLVCIEAGRTIEARRSLLDALNTPTPGVEDARALARYYLRFLEQERQRATASRR
jgi:tetratricopeptide (TPR) repeat protein